MTELRFRSCLHASLTEMATQAARGFEGYAVPVPANPDALAVRSPPNRSTSAAPSRRCGATRWWARRSWHAAGAGCASRRCRCRPPIGFDRQPLGEDAAPAPLPPYGDVLDLATLVAADDAYLPWQLQSATLLGTSAADVYRLGPALAQVTPREDVLHLRALAVPPSGRRRGHGRALVEALAAAYPRSTVRVLATVPAGLAEEFMGAVGFVPSELSQWEMACRLDA